MPAVEVWSVDSAGCSAGLLEVLDRWERDRHALALRRGRPGYGAGRAALRHLLGARLGIEPQRVVFARHCAACEREGHGRPAVAGVDAGAIDFSVATSGSTTLIAIARQGRVGVDVERVGVDLERVGVDGERVPRAERPLWPRPCFSAREREELERLDECERPEAAGRSWVRKEAAAKCLGLGLAMPLRTLEVTGDSPRWHLPEHAVQVCDLELPSPFVGAVAGDGSVAAPAVREWRWN